MSLRELVWDASLKQLRKTGKFRISDLPFDEKQIYTVRRVLREMEKLGWLARENKRAATWRMGEMAKLHLNVSRNLIEESWE